ncbi:MAG: FKBP-type peptidyl-prolyl cis-trans isomerase [Rhodospirillaceae bacterium]
MTAKEGTTVQFAYNCKLDDGTVVDKADAGNPVTATLGTNALMPVPESALIGMAAGEQKSIDVEAENAFGPHRPELVHDLPRERIPPEVDLTPGARLTATGEDEKTIELLVLEADDQKVKLDANHPPRQGPNLRNQPDRHHVDRGSASRHGRVADFHWPGRGRSRDIGVDHRLFHENTAPKGYSAYGKNEEAAILIS